MAGSAMRDFLVWLISAPFRFLWWLAIQVLELLVWLVKQIGDLAVWSAIRLADAALGLLLDMVKQHTAATLTAVATTVVVYWLSEKALAGRFSYRRRWYQTPFLLAPLSGLAALLVTGAVAGTSSMSVNTYVNQTTVTVDGTGNAVNVGGTAKQPFAGVPTEIWAAGIAAVASLGGAWIGRRRN